MAEPASESTKTLSLAEAEEKLYGNSDLLYENVSFKNPFIVPGEIYCHDIYLNVTLQKIPKKLSKSAIEMAKKCKKELEENLFGSKYTAKEADAKLMLKIYLEECSVGNRESRIYAPDSGSGLVKLKFSWLICTINKAVILDGGRFAEVDSRWNGLLDSLFWRSGESTLLYQLLPKLCESIDTRLDIPIKKTGWFD
jgi:hypothetical protein